VTVQVDEDVPPSVTLVATCHTEGCLANGVPCLGLYYANAEEPIYRGMCMPCGQIITDLVPYKESTA
jgi:hypothetical protein